mgnify:CR=1 FL=1
MQTGLNETRQLIRNDQKEYRKKKYTMIAVMAAVLMVSLCLKTEKHGFVPPLEVLANYRTWLEINIGKVCGLEVYLRRAQIIAGMPTYTDSINRLMITAVAFICGVLLSMAGALFQAVFRNPIAAPTMLGVNTGVSLGILVLVLQYGGAALYMPKEKYICCYIGAAGMLALVMIMGKLSSGRRKFAVTDLLIVSAIVSQVVGAVQTYYTFSMENDEVLLLQQIRNAMDLNVEPVSLLFLAIATVVCMVPVFLLRFSLNAVSFVSDEARSLGVNTFTIKITALLTGTFMVTAAMVHCGAVGMISLIVPFMSRAMFGADFRKVFTGNILIGGTLLVICREIAGQIYLTADGIPAGTVVDFIAMPVFVIIIVSQRRIWE